MKLSVTSRCGSIAGLGFNFKPFSGRHRSTGFPEQSSSLSVSWRNIMGEEDYERNADGEEDEDGRMTSEEH